MKTIYVFALFFLWMVFENESTAQDFWVNTNASFASSVTSLLTNSNNEVFALTVSDVIYRSTDNGLTWTTTNDGLPTDFVPAFAISPQTQTLIVCAGTYANIYRSTDNGTSWTMLPASVQAMNLTCSNNGDFFAGTPINGVVRSTDDGLTWTTVSSGLTQWSIYSIGFGDSAMVFASSYENAVYRSTNNGDLWTPIPIPNVNSNVGSLAAYNGILFAGTRGQGVYSTNYNQVNWEQKNNGLTSLYIKQIIINPEGHLYLATASSGIFRSKDGGAGWTDISSGLTELNITCMTFAPDGFIYAGSETGKVYRSNSSTTSINQFVTEIPSTYTLNQNYPNPFNSSTKILYSVPQSCQIIIKVYDVLGNEISTLVNEEKPAGSYEVEFNPASSIQHLPARLASDESERAGRQGPASGIYFYRLQVIDPESSSGQGFIETKKMILIK